MGFIDKAKNAAEDAVGQVKETVGDLTYQGVSGAKKVGENIKDTFTG